MSVGRRRSKLTVHSSLFTVHSSQFAESRVIQLVSYSVVSYRLLAFVPQPPFGGEDARLPYRFILKDNPYVSGKKQINNQI
jgi:hypothetical protein